MVTVKSITEQYDKTLKIELSNGVIFYTHKTDLSLNDTVSVSNFMGMIKVVKAS